MDVHCRKDRSGSPGEPVGIFRVVCAVIIWEIRLAALAGRSKAVVSVELLGAAVLREHFRPLVQAI